MPSLLDLPPEILPTILCQLSLNDLATCQLTHRSLHLAIATSPQVQYHLAVQKAGVEDNKNSPLSVKERLEKLENQEAGWSSLNFDSSHAVKINPEHIQLHMSPSGLLWQRDLSRTMYRYATLPSKLGEPLTDWNCFELEHAFINIGMGIYEHDLLVLLIE